MANQPQPRPWFRLSTLARIAQPPAPAAAPPAPAPQPPTQPPAPRPALIPPEFRPAATQTQTQPQPLPAPGAAPPPPPPPPPRATIPPPAAPAHPPPSVAPAVAPPPAAPRTPASPIPSVTTPAVAPPVPALRPPAPPTSPLTPPRPSASPPPVATVAPPPRTITSPMSTAPASAVTTSRRSPPPTTSPPAPAPKVSPVSATLRIPKFQPPPSVSSSLPVPTKPPSPPPEEVKSPSAITPPPKFLNGLRAAAMAARVRSPIPSPREAKPLAETPPQSPKTKPSFAPPSPLTLPPSQLKSEGESDPKIPAETEKKTVLVQQTAGGKPKSYADQSQVKPAKERDHHHRKFADGEEGGMRIVTITGENKGAIMELSYSPRRNPRGYKIMKSQSQCQAPSDAELSEGASSSNASYGGAQNELPMRTFLNSNVQGVNSSIVFNSTLTHHDPGIHLCLTRKPLNGHGYASKRKEHGIGNRISPKAKEKWFSD